MQNIDDLSLMRKIYRKLCVIFQKQMPDRVYLKMLYYVRLGQKLDLNNPKTFNEKLNWLKLNDRNPLYTELADKYEVRKFVSDVIGEKYLIPLIGVWNSVEEIDLQQLPNQFVLKCTHDSASVVICKDKTDFDYEDAKKKLSEAMHINYFYYSREWPYKDIKPRIIAEKYITDESGTELKDYKIYCFNGHPQLIQVDFGRFVKHERNLYTTNWQYIDQVIEYPSNHNVQIKKPENLQEMLSLSQVLATKIGCPSIRTDFYSCGNKIYFGEITFYQEAGFARFSSAEYELNLGSMIRLPIKDRY